MSRAHNKRILSHICEIKKHLNNDENQKKNSNKQKEVTKNLNGAIGVGIC